MHHYLVSAGGFASTLYCTRCGQRCSQIFGRSPHQTEVEAHLENRITALRLVLSDKLLVQIVAFPFSSNAYVASVFHHTTWLGQRTWSFCNATDEKRARSISKGHMRKSFAHPRTFSCAEQNSRDKAKMNFHSERTSFVALHCVV